MLQRVINENLYNKKANLPIMEDSEELLINDGKKAQSEIKRIINSRFSLKDLEKLTNITKKLLKYSDIEKSHQTFEFINLIKEFMSLLNYEFNTDDINTMKLQIQNSLKKYKLSDI